MIKYSNGSKNLVSEESKLNWIQTISSFNQNISSIQKYWIIIIYLYVLIIFTFIFKRSKYFKIFWYFQSTWKYPKLKINIQKYQKYSKHQKYTKYLPCSTQISNKTIYHFNFKYLVIHYSNFYIEYLHSLNDRYSNPNQIQKNY